MSAVPVDRPRRGAVPLHHVVSATPTRERGACRGIERGIRPAEPHRAVATRSDESLHASTVDVARIDECLRDLARHPPRTS